MKHLYFGSTTRRLFGSYEPARALSTRDAAVLLCNPFGEEAIRAHRTYRVLASQLSSAGYPVLRFDYSGTGDSAGEAVDSTIEAWLEDIASAATQLLATSGARRLVAVGLRLGATLAALGTARRAPPVRHAVLWDPVVEGATYLRELAATHRAYMREEMGTAGWLDRLGVSPDGFPCEALGRPISPALASGVAGIDLAGENIEADHVTVLSTTMAAGYDRLKARLASEPSARWITTSTSVPWDSDAGLNSSVVPMEIVQCIVARVEEASP